MCGLAGIFDARARLGRARSETIVADLSQQQYHRGPDADGLWTSPDGRCVLGHRRLAIIDVEARSNQPMLTEDGRFALVFNGEIYNYKDLRRQLQRLGASFKTDSDTEVLLQAYFYWGDKAFAKLDGMFALALYDVQRNELVLARDRVGEKPLFLARLGDALAFSSEFRPLLSLPGLPHEISEASLYEYFALRYVAAPYTLFESIISVQPGTYQVWRADGTWSEHSYFAYDIPSERPGVDHESYLDELDEALTAAVRTRLVADVPLGAFLSGGVDSVLVCGIAAEGLGSGPRCFSVGFADSPDSEIPHARRIAEAYGLPFSAYEVSEGDLLETAARFGTLLDEPNGDRSCVPTYLLSRLVRAQVTVAVSGDGGDELFGGYGRYAALRQRFDPAGTPIDRVLAYLDQGLPVFRREALDQAFPEAGPQFRRRFAARFTSVFARTELDDIERLRLIDLHSYLPGAVLAKVDRMSMRHALEVRTPFFSPQVLKLSMQLPMALCTDGRLLKLALRRLLARYLPEALIRPVKQGFGMPASFIQRHQSVFDRFADEADEALRTWAPLQGRRQTYERLRQAARDNINSLWAWIALGQWVGSLQT